jgi:hypothetical protein
MYAALGTVAPLIDGITVWSTSSYQSQLKTFMGLIRPATTTVRSNVARR